MYVLLEGMADVRKKTCVPVHVNAIARCCILQGKRTATIGSMKFNQTVHLKIYFVPGRKYTASPLQRLTG